jgi:branched-chain amino acid transport system substrate-binding protein
MGEISFTRFPLTPDEAAAMYKPYDSFPTLSRLHNIEKGEIAMRRMSLIVSLTVVFALICSAAALASEAKGEPIKVGIILPFTGGQAKFGEMEWNSLLMGLEEINKAGGVNGRPIKLLKEDDSSKPAVGRSAAEKLISQDKVLMIGGGYSSSVTAQIAAVAQQYKVPFLVNTGAADQITELNRNFVFRLNPPAGEYFKGLTSFLTEVAKPKTAVILHENSLFGQSSSKKFAKQCEKMGIKVLLKEGYEEGTLSFKPLMNKVKAKNPDLIYMVSYVMDAALLVNAARSLRVNPKLFVGGAAGFTLDEFAKKTGKNSENVFSATLWTPSVPYPGAKAYFDNYVKRFKSPPDYHGVEAYAAIYVIADALKRAKELTPVAVRDALATTDTMTAFGPVKFISYGKKTQQNSLPTYLAQWQHGKLETVWPKNVATKPYVFPVPAFGK